MTSLKYQFRIKSDILYRVEYEGLTKVLNSQEIEKELLDHKCIHFVIYFQAAYTYMLKFE